MLRGAKPGENQRGLLAGTQKVAGGVGQGGRRNRQRSWPRRSAVRAVRRREHRNAALQRQRGTQ